MVRLVRVLTLLIFGHRRRVFCFMFRVLDAGARHGVSKNVFGLFLTILGALLKRNGIAVAIGFQTLGRISIGAIYALYSLLIL
jgi:hypothetical protein